MALLSAAVYGAWGQREGLAGALQHAAQTQWWLVAIALGLPMLNWLVTCGIFYILTGVHSDRVRFGEMCALVGASWLFNYLPASPGLFGRVVYHQTVHGISWTTSAGVVVAAMLTSLCAIATTLVAAGMLAFDSSWLVGVPGLLGIVSLAIAWTCRRQPEQWRIAAALSMRCLDLYVWSARYFVVMHILGLSPTPLAALGLGVVSQTAVLIPFLGNGLGVREWSIGLLGPMLPGWAASATRGAALSLDLVNRACEVVVAVPVGLTSAVWLARRLRGEPMDQHRS